MKLFRAFLLFTVTFCAATLLTHQTAVADETQPEIGYSERNRQDKNIMLLAQPLGFGPTALFSQGLTLGIFLDPNTIINIELKKGDDLFFMSWLDRYDIKENSLGVNFKKFVNTSFYVKAGAEYRKIDYTYNYNSSTTDTNQFKGSALAATFALGNQWQWGGFTLGCDWFGLNVPVTSNIESESSAVSSSIIKLNDEEDKYLKQTSITLVNLYLGASF